VRHNSTTRRFTRNLFVDVSLNGILEFAESVKIPSLDTFPR
jgi:hypothetical protein